jgi:hypothetical protein
MTPLPYFVALASEGRMISCKQWFEACQSYTPAGLFEGLIRYDTRISRDSNAIWGDKSPAYTKYLPLLKAHFPSAVFVHIIRDVRDHCLSCHHAWGLNMLRAAQRWVDTIQDAKAAAQHFPDDYIEVHYESLLDDHEGQLRRICAFLNIPFDTSMLRLEKPVEPVGSAKGMETVLQNNKQKYKNLMNPRLQRKIEKIAGELLEHLGYSITFRCSPQRVPGSKMLLYRVTDRISMERKRLKTNGFIGTFKLFIGFRKLGRFLR